MNQSHTLFFNKDAELPAEKVASIGLLTSQVIGDIVSHSQDFQQLSDALIVAIEEIKNDTYKTLMQVPQNGRNFDIMVLSSLGSLSLTLKNKETGKEFALEGLFPHEGYRFIPSDVDCLFDETLYLGVNLENLNLRGFLFNVLHEIGHSHQRHTSYFQELHKQYSTHSQSDILTLARISCLEERNAWAYALVQARKLEKLGFNVFDSFLTKKDIFEEIGWHLATYDENLFYDILDSFDEINSESMQELEKQLQNRPLFNKKTKYIYTINFSSYE